MILPLARNRRDKAQAALKKGDRGKAIALLEKVLDGEPSDLKVRRQLADLYKTEGQRDAAIRHYEALAGGHAAAGLLLRAVSACKQILELDPDHQSTQRVLADLYAKQRGNRASTATLPPTMSAALLPAADGVEELDDDDILVEDEAAQTHDLEIDDADVLDVESLIPTVPTLLPTLPPDAAETTLPSAAPPPAIPPSAALTLSDEDLEGFPSADGADDEINFDDVVVGKEDLSGEEDDDLGFDLPVAGVRRVHDAIVSDSAHDAASLVIEVHGEDERSAEIEVSGLPTLPLFSDLSRRAFGDLVTRLEIRRVPAGGVVIRQGDDGDSFFVVVSGRVRVDRRAKTGHHTLASLGEGEFFGEIALLHRNQRMATVVAEVETELLEVTRQALDSITESYPSVEKVLRRFCRQRLITSVIRTADLFAGLDRSARGEVVKAFRQVDSGANEIILKQGDPVKALYILMSGSCEVHVEGQQSRIDTLREGDVFGELGLFYGEPASATVRTTSECHLLRLTQTAFDRFCERHPTVKGRLLAIAQARQALTA